ncbi:hypothetical protein ONR57_10345 [Hoyosella sp. YIM 151337]|uniref:hypothetical protein n=1 Tax=Hoyosella sp. YIM 151337 TaxID=2992742 RepID=UPI002236B9AC|nr:hypothetical protein [Hoyosella sp. YIM 151337]MCW4353695.1 hypothetical protein [Hoyosella sp. YIM 151337]
MARSAQRSDAQYKAARRAVARKHHPDLGGDPEAYLQALEELAQQYQLRAGSHSTSESAVVARIGVWRQGARALKRAIRRRARRRWIEI